ncbi:MAG: electron transfer flavoprotein subunit alpha/FixB family protein [Deltaproteobacteria bacterium]|nr:electron transfer flavoprotein subunit alpha/FixB family protein [Deltaproteobacteria bacterium]
MATHLIVAEANGDKLLKATLSTITAAKTAGGDLHGIVLGKGNEALAKELATYVGKVHHAEHDDLANWNAQAYAKVIADCASSISATHVWGAATAAGKDTFPRVAARLDAAMASDISDVVDEKTFKRPMWAGNVIGTVELSTAIKIVTVRGTEFAPDEGGASGEVAAFAADPGALKMKFISQEVVESERPQLADADVVVAGGRGVKGPEGFTDIIEPMADVLGAAIGASRAVCDAGWCPNDWQVGQTGKVVAPDLYIALGISGAIQHVAGMKGSKTIVAINKDEEAPIFQVADYGLVADLFKVAPELTSKIKEIKG